MQTKKIKLDFGREVFFAFPGDELSAEGLAFITEILQSDDAAVVILGMEGEVTAFMLNLDLGGVPSRVQNVSAVAEMYFRQKDPERFVAKTFLRGEDGQWRAFVSPTLDQKKFSA